jgi:hypothetical protein
MPTDLATQLAQQAEVGFGNILKQMAVLTRQAEASRDKISQLASACLDDPSHIYNVFKIGATSQHMVLRDVDEIEGNKPVYTAKNFTDAILWTNRQLTTTVSDPAKQPKTPPSPNASEHASSGFGE